MLNFNLYKLAFIPALLAAVVGAFSLAGIPAPLSVGATTQVFDGDGAVLSARKLIRLAPNRFPGSEGDAAAAAYVRERFKQISAGTVATQQFEGPGDTGPLENVLITLPGTSDRTIAILAGRDSDRVPGAASSAAATALLIELAGELGGSNHDATLVFASVDGATVGSAGTRRLIDGLPGDASIDAAINLSQPGPRARRQPLLVASSAGTESPSAQLVETAAALLATEGRQGSNREGTLGDLARLAFPTGLGEQATLIADGIDAVTLTSAGEAPIPAAADGEDDLGKESIADVGRTAIALIGAIDKSASLNHGPGSYINFAGNLVPGWTLALLALALLAPALALATEETARQSRRSGGLSTLVGWTARVALPPFATLVAIYGLATVGLIPSPPFPFDPGAIRVGVTELIALLFLASLLIGVSYIERIWRLPRGCPRQAVAASSGVLGVAACLIAWLANPYLALLLTPIAHVWIASCRRERSTRSTAVLAVAAALPVLVALIEIASALDWGISAPWQIVLLVADGQIGLVAALALALCWSSLSAALFASRLSPAPPARTRPSANRASSLHRAAVRPSIGHRG